MVLVNIIALVVLILSFFGGLKEGVVKHFFNLTVLIISIYLAGLSYHLLATILSFLPGARWENFVGFFITMALLSLVLNLVLFLPRKFFRAIWRKGVFFRLLGAALNIFNAGIGMVVFSLVLAAYPIIDWLERAVTNASVLTWLAEHLGFVPALLPEVLKEAAPLVANIFM